MATAPEITIRRFVEDLSRMAGVPTLGRAGYTVYLGDDAETHIYDDECEHPETVAHYAAEMVRYRETCGAYWATLDTETRRIWRQRYNGDPNGEQYPTVAYYTYKHAATH